MWFESLGAPYGIMDVRGIAQIAPTSWIICGGIETGQAVTNRSFFVFDQQVGGVRNNPQESIVLYTNPGSNYISLDGEYKTLLTKYFPQPEECC